MRPSSSHLTTASSSLARSTVPNSPVGFPKLPKPSTRSPGINSWPVAEGSESGGLLARSLSGIAPACDRGGWGALRSLGIGLLVLRLISCFFPTGQGSAFAATVHPHDRCSIVLERRARPVQTAQFLTISLAKPGAWGSTAARSAVYTTNMATPAANITNLVSATTVHPKRELD
jgi:hypothetical protein